MHRFFVPPDWLEEDGVTIVGSLVHQIRNVLRLGPGDHVVVLDNSGWEQEVEIVRVGKEHVSGQVVDKRLASGEPRTKITLYQGVLKGKRFEFALQKGTELGIVEFVPLISDRCVIASLDDVDKKRERWQRIILEAAEQCRRGRLPRLRPAMLFRPACEGARRGGLSLIPWEEAHDHDGEGATSLRSVLQGAEQAPFSVNLFVGPEGGFTPDEVELARQYGLIPISLGPRILRAETAGLVAAAAILYELGDLE
jgi:16S rRNA (uracil1498-N3)-methyltransferase